VTYDLWAFSGHDPVCDKCGEAEDILTVYHPATPFGTSQFADCPACKGPAPEHIFRQCSYCGFAWAELTVGAEEG
jgi:hypothetical protein